MDVSPLERDVERLEKRARTLQISAEQNTGRARDAQNKAVKVLMGGEGEEWWRHCGVGRGGSRGGESERDGPREPGGGGGREFSEVRVGWL